MPKYTYKGKAYDVPEDKVEGFLSRKPEAQPLDAGSPIMTAAGIGTPKTEVSTPRESNIQNTQGNFAQTGGIATFSDGARYIPSLKHPSVGEVDTKLSAESLYTPKSNLQITREAAYNSPDVQKARAVVEFDTALSRYDTPATQGSTQQKPNMSLAGLPIEAVEWLKKNEVAVRPQAGYRAVEGGMTYMDTMGNTPEQIARVRNFIDNTPEGQSYAQVQKDRERWLDEQISALEAKIEETAKNAPKTNRSIVIPGGSTYGAVPSYVDAEVPEGFEDIMTARGQLIELNKLKDAVAKGDSSAWNQFWGEIGRRGSEGIMNIATLGLSKPLTGAGINQTLQDPDNTLTAEATDLLNEWQYIHANDISNAVKVASGVYDSAAFMAQFALGGGALGSLTKRAATALASRLGGSAAARVIGGMSDVIGSSIVRTALSPSTYARAYEMNAADPGSFLNALGQSAVQNMIEYATESVGAYMPGIGKLPINTNTKFGRFLGAAGNIMRAVGIQSGASELGEEYLAESLHSLVGDGQGSWESFTDPNFHLITAATVGIFQLPYAGISAAGYASGKFNNVVQKRSVRKSYDTNIKNIDTLFGNNAQTIRQFIDEQVDANPASLPSLADAAIGDEEMTDAQRDAIVKYGLSRIAKSGLEKAKTEEVETAAQAAPSLVQENINPQMNAMVSAKMAGSENPVQIVGGNIVQREDGTIDAEHSDNEIFYVDADGNRQVAPVSMVEGIVENIPTEEATAQITTALTAPIIARQENDEVREYTPGEPVRVQVGQQEMVGEITGVSQDGNYTFMSSDGAQIEIEPRQIVNEDNLIGVENGTSASYIKNGTRVDGIVATSPDLYLSGVVGFENGDIAPIQNIIGPSQPEATTSGTAPATATNPGTQVSSQPIPATGEGTPSEQEQVEQTETPQLLGAQTAPTVNIEAIITNAPKQKDGTVDYDALIETDPESFAALYESEEGAEETRAELEAVSSNIGKGIASAQKQLDGADSINKRKAARAKIASLTDKQARIDRIISERYSTPTAEVSEVTTPGSTVVETVDVPVNTRVESPIEEQARRERRRKNTPFENRLQATIDLALGNLRARILYGIASGEFKFQWRDSANSPGLARELGLVGSESERRARIGIISNEGYTPETLAEAMRDDTMLANTEALDALETRDEILDILKSVYSRKQALDALEAMADNGNSLADMDKDDIVAYEAEQILQEQALQEEIFEQLAAQDVENLLTFAEEMGMTVDQLNDIYTYSDLVEQLNLLKNGTDILPETEDGGPEADRAVDGTENPTGTTEPAVGEPVGSAEEGGDRTSDRDSAEDNANLTEDEQRIVDNAAAAFDAEVADTEARLRQRRADLAATRNRIGQAYTADNQTSLFPQGETAIPGNLFNVPRDYSRENVEDILVPIQQDIDALVDDLTALTVSRDSRIQSALDNFRSQPTILDAIAQAEAETDTNPTEAQKQAGNYKMGHVKVQGFDISIENPKGSVRSGVDENGREWSQEMQNTYGYFGKTKSKDGDHIDVFLGDNPENDTLFVVDQVNPATGQFDEHKVMLGFDTIEEARDAYLSNYEDGWQGLGGITETDTERFRTWAQSDGRRVKPFVEYRAIQNVQAQSNSSHFKPIAESKFNRLIELLRRTGIAKDIVVDHDAVQKKILDLFGDNGTERYQVLINPREPYENTRGDWTRAKILRYLKEAKKAGYDNIGKLLSYIAQFDTPEELRNHLFYHGTSGYVSGNLYPSITMSDREVEQRGGGGYGEKYWAISLSSAKNRSKNFGGPTSPYVTIYPVLLNKNAVVINMPQYGDSNNLEDGIEQLWNDGIDAVRLGNWTEESSEQEIAVLNPYAISVVHDLGQTFKQFNLGRLNNPTDEDLQDIISKAKAYVSESEEIKQSLPYPNSNGLSDREYLDKRKPITQERRARDRELIMQILHDTPTRLMATPKGDVYGFVTPDGKVYIDGSRMNANTPIHEFGHLWNSMIKESNPELWARGSALIRESDYWRQVNDNPAYHDLSDDRKVDEALAMAIGNKGEDAFNNGDVVAYAGLKGWLYQAWEWIKSKLGIARGTNIEDMTLGDFTDLALGQLLGGKNMVNSIGNSIFANENDSKNGTGAETRLGNSRSMGSVAFRRALGEPTIRGGVYRTVQAADAAGSDVTNLTAEQIGDLETRGIDPNFSILKFREAIEENARREGVWIEDDFLDDKTLIHDHRQGYTAENDIYLNSDGLTITKLNNLYTVGGSARNLNFAHLIDRINSHNELFPNVAYNVVGFTNNKYGQPSLVMEQRFVENARYATSEEIDLYLERTGWVFDEIEMNWRRGDKYILSDARPANVLRGGDGAFYFIDTIPNSVAYLNEDDATSDSEVSMQEVPEMEQIRQRAVADGTFMKAPNGQRTNLAERQWLQVRTSNFKNWFGDWEKVVRIEKLRNSTPVEITGQEIMQSKDLKEYKANALEYGKSLRGSYENSDTGETINVGMQALKEVLRHDGGSVAHIQSVAAIPAILENGIYIDTVENESQSTKPNIRSYDYYVVGLKIGGVDYTVKAAVANDRDGTRYYDHALTQIEKTNLLDEVEGVTSPTRQKGDSVLLSEVKDKRLISILQTNSSKIVDENGEPRVVAHSTNREFTEFKNKQENDSGWLGAGYYFFGDRSLDGEYGKNVMQAFLNVREPYFMAYDEVRRLADLNDTTESRDFTLDLIGDGYDGVYFNGNLNQEIAVFNPNQIKSANDNTGEFSADNNDIRFQSISQVADAVGSTMTEDVREELDRRLDNFKFRFREAWEDQHLAVKKFFDILRKHGVTISEYNDYYQQVTALGGKNQEQLEVYEKRYHKPLNDALRALEDIGLEFREIENYVILKHGLERNAWMSEHAEGRPREDYSGITAVEEEVGMKAQEYIDRFEQRAGQKNIENLWDRIKAATSFSLKKQLEAGLISRELYDDLLSRYEYYVPLRGHDVDTAADKYDYNFNMGTYFVAPLKRAKGRISRSESPFAYIFNMAQSAINSSNRNILNQTILRLAQKDKTGLMSVSKAWYVQSGQNEDGTPTYEVQAPTYSEDPEQYQDNIEAFEARMKELEAAGQAKQVRSKLNLGGLFITRSQAKQHEVHVFQNGNEYIVYINANPAVADAINGTNVKDPPEALQLLANVTRQMAANFTTRNPVFILSNFSRDYIYSSSILAVKEDVGYALQFQKNLVASASALQRYVRGKADLSKQQDRYLSEFIMNGGKTGFSHMLDLQSTQRNIERDIRRGQRKTPYDRSVGPVLNALEAMNDMAENMSRLSVYITSREQGRSVSQSISDAKEVTVNFNRRGAGGMGARYIRPLYLFVNAGIQALSNFLKVAAKNKGKSAILLASYTLTAALMPCIALLLGGEDGYDEYMKLSDWERQNNLCIYTGNGFIKIPLPHELRVFHRIGDNFFQAFVGHRDWLEALGNSALGFADLVPSNPLGAIDGSWADIMPDGIKPLFQWGNNRTFTGSRILNEWADPNKPGYLKVRTNKKGEPYAPAFLVKLAEGLDTMTGGDGVKKGFISLNPDVINHLMRGYFGGLYTMASQGLSIADKTIEFTQTGKFNIKVRETPLRTFFTSSDDFKISGNGLQSRYFKISDDVKETLRRVKGYQDQVSEGKIGVIEYGEKIRGLDIQRANEVSAVIKRIGKYEDALNDFDGEEQKELEREIANLKGRVIELYSE